MKGNEKNKIKIRTNMVQMPAGVFIFTTLLAYMVGRTLCESERRRRELNGAKSLLKKNGFTILGEYDDESGDDEE